MNPILRWSANTISNQSQKAKPPPRGKIPTKVTQQPLFVFFSAFLDQISRCFFNNGCGIGPLCCYKYWAADLVTYWALKDYLPYRYLVGVLHCHLIAHTIYIEYVTWARIAERYSAGLWAGWSGIGFPGREWEFFSSPSSSDRLWGLPSLLPNGYQGLFPWR
jgi:hypothetical protein